VTACTLREILQAPDAIGVLVRDVPMRVLNVSGSGCLIESASPFESGAVASIAVRIDGEDYRDDVRVVRCQRVEGAGSTYQLGAEFLWTTPPGARSLRRVMRTLRGRRLVDPEKETRRLPVVL